MGFENAAKSYSDGKITYTMEMEGEFDQTVLDAIKDQVDDTITVTRLADTAGADAVDVSMLDENIIQIPQDVSDIDWLSQDLLGVDSAVTMTLPILFGVGFFLLFLTLAFLGSKHVGLKAVAVVLAAVGSSLGVATCSVFNSATTDAILLGDGAPNMWDFSDGYQSYEIMAIVGGLAALCGIVFLIIAWGRGCAKE